MKFTPDWGIVKVRLVHSFFPESDVNLLILQVIIGFDAVDAHVVLDPAINRVILVLLPEIVPPIDGHTCPRGDLQLRFLGFPSWVDFH